MANPFEPPAPEIQSGRPTDEVPDGTRPEGTWSHTGPTWEEGWQWIPAGTGPGGTDPVAQEYLQNNTEELEMQWGADAIHDPSQNPIGEPNYNVGSWWYDHNGGNTMDSFDYGWRWKWGVGPDQAEINNGWGEIDLTDPTRPPGAGSGTPPNVPVQGLADVWGGHVPDATGGTPSGESGATLSGPPTVNMFMASPGGIRYAEVVIYSDVQQSTQSYEHMRGVVADSAVSDIFYVDRNVALGSPGHINTDQLINTQNALLAQVRDSITLTSDFVNMLNAAVQNYAKADRDSFPPPE